MSKGTEEPRVTIVVVPREQFSVARRSLESIYEHTEIPFALVYVDGNSPRALKAWLEEQSSDRPDFTLLRSEQYLSPNEARNWAIPHVHTPYVVFVDNDLIASPGWLSKLIECADVTGAWAVGPLYLEGEQNDRIIHMAGGVCSFSGERPARSFETEHLLQHVSLDALETPLVRGECDFVEFHCMLCPTQIFETLGPLDAKLINTREHLDLCISIREAGGSVVFEPSSVVTYKSPPPLRREDRPFFWLRWSEAWTQRSLKHFMEKHGLEPAYLERRTISTARRSLIFRGFNEGVARLLGDRVARGTADLLMRVEAVTNRLLVRTESGKPFPTTRP